MTETLIVAAAIAALGLPIWMVICIRRLYGGRPRDKATVAVGNALQELDRLVARPSIVYKMEAESEVRPVDDDRGES